MRTPRSVIPALPSAPLLEPPQRVYIVRGDRLEWDAIATCLGALSRATLVGAASAAARAPADVQTLQPDLVLAQMQVGGSSSRALLGELAQLSPASRWVLFAEQFTAADLRMLPSDAIRGCLLWDHLRTDAL